jgi:anti-sigma factor RsiW
MTNKIPNTRKLSAHDYSCKAAISLIGNYLAGSIAPTVHADFERHLHLCPDCAAFLQTYKKTIEATRALLRNQPTPHLRGMNRLEKRGGALAAFTFSLHLFLSHVSLIVG